MEPGKFFYGQEPDRRHVKENDWLLTGYKMKRFDGDQWVDGLDLRGPEKVKAEGKWLLILFEVFARIVEICSFSLFLFLLSKASKDDLSLSRLLYYTAAYATVRIIFIPLLLSRT